MSNDTFPQRLTEIDDLTRPDHWHLGAGDKCLYFGEYSAREGYTAGPTNQLIFNFKKGVDRRGRPEWFYKERSITQAAAAFSSAINAAFLAQATLVPIPPSKAKDDARYDDRLVRMLRQMRGPAALDVREFVVQNGTREAAAHDGARLGPDQLEAMYTVDEAVAHPAPRVIGLFDDTLVTGASFVAGRRVLQARFPNVQVYGFFIARRALPDPAKFFEMVEE